MLLRYKVIQHTEATVRIGAGLVTELKQGEWYALPYEDGTKALPLDRAIGPSASRPDLEALLVGQGIGFMDIIE
jgi:hypothetical protein